MQKLDINTESGDIVSKTMASIDKVLASLSKEDVNSIVQDAISMNFGGATLEEYITDFKQGYHFIDSLCQDEGSISLEPVLIRRENSWNFCFKRMVGAQNNSHRFDWVTHFENSYNHFIFWEALKPDIPIGKVNLTEKKNHWNPPSGFLF